jgi:hypothetical protein
MQHIAAEKIRWRTEIIEIREEDFAQTLPMIDIDHLQVEVDRCRKSGCFSHVILLLL